MSPPLPSPLTAGQIPRTRTFDAVFWDGKIEPVRVRCYRGSKLVNMERPDTGGPYGFVPMDSGMLWLPIYYDALVAAWQQRKLDDSHGD